MQLLYAMSYADFDQLLSCTERRILRHCMNDESCQAIADAMNISAETVRTHRKSLIRKLGVSGKVQFRQALRRFAHEGH